VDAREERLAQNEVLFRSVNERIEETAHAQGDDAHLFEFICECSNIDCTLRLPLTLSCYEAARSDPATFIVAPGHELPEIEDVIERGAGYQIVRKVGAAAALAAEQDPRT
jgi:hypothetical protein